MEKLIEFKVPTAEDRKRALGALGGTNFKVKKALEEPDKYWKPKNPPGPSDWLSNEFECGQQFDVIYKILTNNQEFRVNKNAILEKGISDTICILPLDKKMSKSFLKNLTKMCEAFFTGCKIKLLPGISMDTIDNIESRIFPGDPYSPDAAELV